MSLSKTINYDSAANFTFDTNTIEVTTDAKLKDLISPDEVLYGDFTTKDLLRAAGGSLVATLNGGATINAGRLEHPNANGYWHIDPTGMLPGTGVGGASNKLCIRFKVTPQYTGAPATTQYFYEEKVSSGRNRVWIYHSATSIKVEFRNYLGAGSGTLISGTFSPVSGTTYEIELNVDSTLGTQKLYIDGVQSGPDHAAVFDRNDPTTDNIFVGVSSIAQNFFMDDLQRFSEMQHTADFASEIPRVVPATKYDITRPSIIENGFIEAEALMSLSDVVVTPTNTSVTHIINVVGQDKYWDGAAWVNSNGTGAQSNSSTDINTNIAALDISTGNAIKIKSILTTTDGVSTPTLTSLTFMYDFFSNGTSIKKCIVHGYIYDGLTAVSGASITFKADPYFDTLNNVININESTTTRSNGYFELDVPVTDFTGTDDDVRVAVKMSFIDSTGKNAAREFEIKVPDSGAIAIENIVV